MIGQIKFDAYMQEFPALSEIFEKCELDAQDCDKIQIKRADANLMARKPETHEAAGSLVGIYDAERVMFVTRDGGVMIDAVTPTHSYVCNYAHCDGSYREGETILDAIHRHGVTRELECIVVVEHGYNVEDHYSQRNWRATVYKPARNWTFHQIVYGARAKAVLAVRAEAAF